jgi:hypothetical protein
MGPAYRRAGRGNNDGVRIHDQTTYYVVCSYQAGLVRQAASWHCQPKCTDWSRPITGPEHLRMAESSNPFRYFDSSPEVIRLVVMIYMKYPLSLRGTTVRNLHDRRPALLQDRDE